MSSEAFPNSPGIVPGALLAGKYRVDRIIGQGGMGVVVSARHVALDERVALKFLLPEYAQHPEASTRFLREARAAVKIKSEHVARVSDVGTLETGAPYMVMEFLEGEDLSKKLEKGVLRIDDAVDFIIQGCEAIAEAHANGIVHRDLKPANLFLTRRPDGSHLVKVLDFGISKVMGGAVENLTKTTAAMGSALYMSPEQMQQTRAVDHRTDIYALGVALYELLAGKQPYYAETLPQLCAEILTGVPTPLSTARPEVAPGLAAAIEKAYARDRGARHQSVAEFVVALAPWAPARSQGTIDRICRMGGMDIAIAGAAGAPGPGNAPLQGGTALMQGGSNGSGMVQSNPNLIQPGAYAGPASEKAAAAFASGTNMDLSAPARAPASSGRAGLLAAIALTVLAMGGAAAYLLTQRGATPAPPATAAQLPPAADKPAVTATAAPAALAAPTAPAVGASAAVVEPAASASASATAAARAASNGRAPPVNPVAPAKATVAVTAVAVAPPPTPPPPPAASKPTNDDPLGLDKRH